MEKRSRGRPRKVDGERAEFVGFYVPQDMYRKIVEESQDNNISISKFFRLLVISYFHKDEAIPDTWYMPEYKTRTNNISC